MTIFPCSRCGRVPELKPANRKDRHGRPGAMLVHVCRSGRELQIGAWAENYEEAAQLAVYRHNEQHAHDNPKWWPERYDYLMASIKPRGEASG